MGDAPVGAAEFRARCGLARINRRYSIVGKRIGNREMKKPKQNKQKGSDTLTVAELAKAGKQAVGKRR